MKIEVWSDFACPFCYIGKRRFEAALERFEHKSEVEVVFRSFELAPDAPRDNDQSMHAILASKYGMSLEQAKAMNANMTEQAKTVGLTYHFDTMKPTNTFDAHRLTHWAGEFGQRYDMTERLFKAYFTDSEHLGDRQSLARLAGEIGLDAKAAADMLESDAYKADVREDESQASKLGISGVPFFVVNQKYGISGAQPEDVFVDALQNIWKEDHPLTMVGGSDDLACQDGSCALPTDKA
ncbi:DsbA family oxidoreductase [Paenibacillus chibensis]|uniref:DsbA family oxidoreductase n=1 Tax=Paenibacillus chibensis TaxID=59846 RepID=A0ABU6Q1B7_9BACL|nr:DsbA family oxidoreductase [Paenibacillus chibensis]MEC0368454.1 DsbA family oxidoreductase [Paenibacillus chibensis]MED5020872.1 DsbA family oxidoreductase [Paenibacillus chibensis]